MIVGGPETGSGRVEIIRNGLRGTVCDDSWDDKDATVVCKMAGYKYDMQHLYLKNSMLKHELFYIHCLQENRMDGS